MVFVLQHAREMNGYEEIKFIGVYSSLENASLAIERLLSKPGFCDYPEGFHIDAYQVDQDNWVDGFATV